MIVKLVGVGIGLGKEQEGEGKKLHGCIMYIIDFFFRFSFPFFFSV